MITTAPWLEVKLNLFYLFTFIANTNVFIVNDLKSKFLYSEQQSILSPLFLIPTG